MWFESFLFYAIAALLLGAGAMVILVRNTVYSALFLVLAFVASGSLWLLLEAEFLALILILVYIGAVMTLFLFVVMMLNLDVAPRLEGFVRYLPFGLMAMALIVAGVFFVLGPQHFGLQQFPVPTPAPADYSNVSALGDVLYTHYVFPFELAAVLLLAAIIAAISLSLHKPRAKLQQAREQQQIKPKDRVELIK